MVERFPGLCKDSGDKQARLEVAISHAKDVDRIQPQDLGINNGNL